MEEKGVHGLGPREIGKRAVKVGNIRSREMQNGLCYQEDHRVVFRTRQRYAAFVRGGSDGRHLKR